MSGIKKKIEKVLNWQVLAGLSLIILSVAVYFAHYLIFRDLHHIFIYLIGDIAFVFLEVLLVTLILHQFLERREKRLMMNKLNMLIGTFFSEIGRDLLLSFIFFDANPKEFSERFLVSSEWSAKDFMNISRFLRKRNYNIDLKKGDLDKLKALLISKRFFLLSLLGNPNVLEHESFTDVLWAVFHLLEELSFRKDLSALPQADYHHLAGDLQRAYSRLVSEWFYYMKHLKASYPYLFSLAMRTNPFNATSSVEIR